MICSGWGQKYLGCHLSAFSIAFSYSEHHLFVCLPSFVSVAGDERGPGCGPDQQACDVTL